MEDFELKATDQRPLLPISERADHLCKVDRCDCNIGRNEVELFDGDSKCMRSSCRHDRVEHGVSAIVYTGKPPSASKDNASIRSRIYGMYAVYVFIIFIVCDAFCDSYQAICRRLDNPVFAAIGLALASAIVTELFHRFRPLTQLLLLVFGLVIAFMVGCFGFAVFVLTGGLMRSTAHNATALLTNATAVTGQLTFLQ